MINLKTLFACAALITAAPMALAQTPTTSDVASAESVMITAHVKGMVCDFCARAVTKVFKKEDAVEMVHVDLDKGEIHIGLKPGQSLSDDRVKELIRDSGYALEAVERETL